MSSEALVEGPKGDVWAAWETTGQVYFGRVEAGAIGQIISAPGEGKDRKHPALAVNARGEALLAWTEGTGWNRGGALAWQVHSPSGEPTGEKGRLTGDIPVWGLATAVPRPDGGFTLIH